MNDMLWSCFLTFDVLKPKIETRLVQYDSWAQICFSNGKKNTSDDFFLLFSTP